MLVGEMRDGVYRRKRNGEGREGLAGRGTMGGRGWRLEAGGLQGWRLEAGGWRLEAGGLEGRRLEARGWRLEGCK
jgi:hypothetical protein